MRGLKPRAQCIICSVPAPFRSSSRRIQVHPEQLEAPGKRFPERIACTDTPPEALMSRSFFERSKKYLARLEKTSQLLPIRKAPAGRSVLAIINETVLNLGGLASVASRRCVIILAVGSLTMNAHVYSGTENSLKKAASLNQDSVWAAPRR